MDLMEIIQQRRAVRDYTERPVTRETVMSLLKAAVLAPSAVNLQPWVFAVIQDMNLLRRYSDRTKSLQLESGDLHLKAPEFRKMLSDPAFNIFYNAGTLILICAKPLGQHPDWDCCLAGENLMLAAHGMGLGTCPIGFAWPLFAKPDVKAELQIPADYNPILPIIVGYPTGASHPVTRKDPEISCWR
jgi:nitroreductase